MKNLFACLALLVVGAIFAASFVTAADGPAIVIKDDGVCGMPGADANGDIIFGGIGQVETGVENGNRVMLKCKGNDLINDSGRAQSFKGFICGIAFPGGGSGTTTDTHATVSASHVGTMTCAYTK